MAGGGVGSSRRPWGSFQAVPLLPLECTLQVLEVPLLLADGGAAERLERGQLLQLLLVDPVRLLKGRHVIVTRLETGLERSRVTAILVTAIQDCNWPRKEAGHSGCGISASSPRGHSIPEVVWFFL